MQLGYSILVSTSRFQVFGRSLQAPANAQTCLLAEAETSRSAWYPRMQVLVEFVLHGPSSAFPCVTNEYAPYKQQVLLAGLRLYATDPGCVTWRRQRPETARSARHTRIRRAHTAHPQTFTPTGATGVHHARHVPLPLPSVIHGHPALRLYTTARGWSQPAIGSPLRNNMRNKPTPKRRVRPVWRSYAQRTC